MTAYNARHGARAHAVGYPVTPTKSPAVKLDEQECSSVEFILAAGLGFETVTIGAQGLKIRNIVVGVVSVDVINVHLRTMFSFERASATRHDFEFSVFMCFFAIPTPSRLSDGTSQTTFKSQLNFRTTNGTGTDERFRVFLSEFVSRFKPLPARMSCAVCGSPFCVSFIHCHTKSPLPKYNRKGAFSGAVVTLQGHGLVGEMLFAAVSGQPVAARDPDCDRAAECGAFPTALGEVGGVFAGWLSLR